MRITRMRVLAAVVAAGALAGIGSAAVVAAGDSGDGVIHACRHPNGGWLRMIAADGSCRQREQAVEWNVQGPPGPKGDKGDPGAGLTKLDDLEGIACTADGGGAGTVKLDVAGDDTVLLRCVAGGEPPPPPPPPPSGAKLVINEVDYDQVGTDSNTAGFVEIKNVGDSAVDLTGISLVFVDGGQSTEYKRQDLTGSLAAGDYVVVDTDAQNGAPDGLALVDTAAGTLIDALSYEGEIHAATIDTKTFDLVEGTALPAEVADSNTIDGSLIRNPDGADTNDAATDWKFTTTLTPGAANVLTAAP
jgi:lamin tail-like protein